MVLGNILHDVLGSFSVGGSEYHLPTTTNIRRDEKYDYRSVMLQQRLTSFLHSIKGGLMRVRLIS